MIAVAVVLVGAGFGGGYTFAKSQSPANGMLAAGFPEGTGGQFAGRSGSMGMGTRAGGGFVSGEILSKDSTSVTVKMIDGSTKIVLLGSSAQISKSAEGTAADLAIGASVLVNGSTNSDGSVTAQNVQIRPMGMGGFASSTRQQP